MTNVSKKRVDVPDYKSACDQFSQLIATLNKTSAPKLLNGLLTEAEHIMLIKRFTSIVMLERNHSTYEISRVVGISLSTAQRLQFQFESGQFDGLITCIPKSQKSALLDAFQDFALSRASYKARNRMLKRVLG